MVPRRDRREAVLFRLECQSRPVEGFPREKGPHIDLADIVEAWRRAITANQAARYFDAAGNVQPGPWQPGYSQLKLEQVETRTEQNRFRNYTLLLSYANAKAADPAKRDMTTNAIDVLTLGTSGALAFAAHLVIGKREEAGARVNTYKCVLEDMMGLGRNRVMYFLQELADAHIDPACRPRWVKVLRNKQTVELVGKPRLNSYPEKSDTLKKMVQQGRITSIQFLKEAPDAALTDGLPASLKVDQLVMTGNAAERILTEAGAFARSLNWSLVKAVIEQQIDDEVHAFVRPFDLEATDLDDQVYARREPFKVAGDLPQCYPAINTEVETALQEMLGQAHLWT
jgi:hypothetical protein